MAIRLTIVATGWYNQDSLNPPSNKFKSDTLQYYWRNSIILDFQINILVY